MSRRGKKNGRSLIVFEQIFANHVYPLCGSPHPSSILQHMLFNAVPAGGEACVFCCRKHCNDPCCVFFIHFWCNDKRCEVLASSLMKASPHPFSLFSLCVHSDDQTRCVLLQAHCGCEEKTSRLPFALLE